MAKSLSTDKLKIDGNTQSRIKINEATVEEYAELAKDWPFPPLDVFFDGTDHYVADGFHRLLAAIRAKVKTVPCTIHAGTAHDARIFGMTANDRHGLRMTRADKRACVEWLIANGGKMTQKEIAEKAGVSPRTVKAIIDERKDAVIVGKDEPHQRGQKAKTSTFAAISGEYQQRAVGKHPDGSPIGVNCPNCKRYGREVDWWFDDACGLCLEPLPDPADPFQEANENPTEPEAPEKPDKPVKAKTGREAELFRAKQCLNQWKETIRHMMSDSVSIDGFRGTFPGPLGDTTIEAAKRLYEALDKWQRGIR